MHNRMSSAAPTECFECGVALSAGDTSGLCVKCILRTGLVSQFGAGALRGLAGGLTPDAVVREAFDFGGYRILSLLGRGGMGAVYEAEQIASGRRVALKVLGTTLDSPEARARFVLEGQLAAAVRHPNVVAVFAAEEIEGAAVIAMEIVPSGTLKDRVSSEGPMPPGVAVDTVLQIIDGLEAAHTQGVLHRDIKPANCFLAPDGTVKVGDFGLSISLVKMAESHGDDAREAVGTPAFASPEQLCGEKIDVRADIYSVGATLYFLLTGKCTHDEPTVEAVIAAVLERDPVEPSNVQPGIPRDLSRTVMRCLARKAGARFESYGALRAALLPFRSGAPVPAQPGIRFVAGLIDLLVMIAPSLAFHSAKGSESGMLIDRDAASVGVYLAFVAWEIFCVCLPEGLWGAGLGKAVCGLRTVARGGGAPGVPRALVRGVILALAMHLGDAVTWLLRTPSEYQDAVVNSRFLPEEMLGVLLLVLLFAPMRRRNGYAAVQDLLTGTRVIFAPVAISRLAIPDALANHGMPVGKRIGPFAEVSREGEWIFARDEALDRRVWIRSVAPGTPAIAAARRDVCRTGRLRWLTGRRSPEENWDAYEAPDGAPLASFLVGEQPWGRVRSWLLDLAEEFEASFADGTQVAAAGTDRLWLTRQGRVLLLDFPAPGASHGHVRAVHGMSSAQEFLHDVAAAALPLRIPLHAREFLSSLGAHTFHSQGAVVAQLRADVDRPAEVNLQRRLLGVIIAPAIALGIMLTISLSNSRDARRFDALWAREHANLPSLRLMLEVLREQSAVNPATAERCATVLAGRYREIITGVTFWGRPETEAWHEAARRAIGTGAAPGAAAWQSAEEWIAPYLQARREREKSLHGWLLGGTAAALNFLLLGALLGTGGTLLSGVPPGLRMNDLAVVNADGAPASRMCVLWRGLLGWLPQLLGALALALCQIVPGAAGVFPFVVIAFVLALAWLLSLTVRNPSRGLNDIIAGTWLVPR
jgi:uncharacterized RDD family membrane protein YckC